MPSSPWRCRIQVWYFCCWLDSKTKYALRWHPFTASIKLQTSICSLPTSSIYTSQIILFTGFQFSLFAKPLWFFVRRTVHGHKNRLVSGDWLMETSVEGQLKRSGVGKWVNIVWAGGVSWRGGIVGNRHAVPSLLTPLQVMLNVIFNKLCS